MSQLNLSIKFLKEEHGSHDHKVCTWTLLHNSIIFLVIILNGIKYIGNNGIINSFQTSLENKDGKGKGRVEGGG